MQSKKRTNYLNPQPELKPNRAELTRLKKLQKFEISARDQGFTAIAGVDEVGRGPLAGPVVAAACIIPEHLLLVGVDDSKALTPIKRQKLAECISKDSRIKIGVGIVDHLEIDLINIYQASKKAMRIAVANLSQAPDLLLVDGMKLDGQDIPSWGIIHGDALSQSIAAASIIAKVTRDRLMEDYHKQWPEYGFDQHKGYATAMHRKALAAHGMCPIHRAFAKPYIVNPSEAEQELEVAEEELEVEYEEALSLI